MAFSYSFHLSSKGNAVSTTTKVGQVSRHNLRDYKSANYNKNDISILVGGDSPILKNVKKIYHQEFDEALEKYNKGKRADRQIEDYLAHISNSKADIGAEIIIQVGDKDFWKDIDKDEWKRLDRLFEKQLAELQKIVPEFKVASAVVHYDESSPHMHVVGVPVSEGFKKGLEKQVSKTRVFTADRLTFLQDKMRENVQECMKEYPDIFEDRQLKEKEKGRNKDIPKEKLKEYYELEKNISIAKDELAAVDEVSQYLSNKLPQIKKEQVKDGFLSSHEAVVIEGMDAKEVENVFKANAIQEGVTKRAKQTIKHAQGRADQLRVSARNEIKEAQSVLKERDSILARAKEEAKNIIDSIKSQVDKLLRRKEALEEEIEAKQREAEEIRSKTILEANLERERIINDAYASIGQDKLKKELEDMLGIVPHVEIKRAYETLEDTWNRFNSVSYTNPTEDDFEAFKRLDADYMARMDEKVQHGLYKTLEKDMRKYLKALNSPHSKEEVLEQIREKELIRERKHVLTR